MRLTLGFLFLMFLMGCTESKQNQIVDDIIPDTLYQPTIVMDDGTGAAPHFQIGDTSTLRIGIRRLMSYELRLTRIKGATITKVDTARNFFFIIPNDKKFSFVLNQFYPKGRVVRYSRDWNVSKMSYDEKIDELAGLIEICELDFKAK